jgi:dihydroneopterin aldolase
VSGTDSIIVKGIVVEGCHGLLGERDDPQPFVVDIELDLNIAAVAKLDRLETTIDYVWVERIVRRVIEEKSFELLETLAHTIAEEVLAFGGEAVRVKVSKPGAAQSLGVDEVSAVVERSRD